MTAVTLTHKDEPRHTRRFYRLNMQPDLFGQWTFVRECGCIGPPSQTRRVLYEAEEALGRQRRRKERPGCAAPGEGAS